MVMDVFSALADPTRRRIVEILAMSGQLPASDIYKHFESTPPAISQHLKVLRQAEVVKMEKQAQQRLYTVNTAKVEEVEVWARRTVQLWSERFDRLEALLQEEMEEK
ncbi:MAG: winged helix-turn-helix transcriptional regulator [Anaerolineales bacterium]|nr:winged helix-turn-helix transcriptional regulator [Anaerolineales bacterium]